MVVLAGLVAVLVVLVRRESAQHARDRARDAVLAAARLEAVNLTSLDYTTAARDLDRIVAGSTGALRAKFVAEQPQFPAVLARDKSRSRGTVLATALVDVGTGGDTAQVAVAADATVTTGTGSAQQSALKHYRMVMKLQRVGARWLVSDVAFAGGLPQ
jgi:hypothetical protein